mmetsp:Transcript_12359/g.29023  ORF Transcript_12359/g.29023 Transcript_12359/m.29023 type:complete len:222 (-) Transcript_12359:808-1473(-)
MWQCPTMPGHGNVKFCSSSSGTPSSSLSTLLNTRSWGVFTSKPGISSKVLMTVLICCAAVGDEASTTCSSSVASRISSRVARKPTTRNCGSRCTKPTVSTSMASRPFSSRTRRRVGSRVSKSLSTLSTSLLPKSLFIKVDLPALVYPTKAITGKPSFFWFLRTISRCFRTSLISLFTSEIFLTSWVLSLAYCVSPAPRKGPLPVDPATPPPRASRPPPSVR